MSILHIFTYFYRLSESFHQTIRVIDFSPVQGAVSWDLAREHRMEPAQWSKTGGVPIGAVENTEHIYIYIYEFYGKFQENS